MSDYVDIKPITPPIFLDKVTEDHDYLIEKVSPIIGMATSFIRKATGKKKLVNEKDILFLLELDAFTETFVPRSKVLQFLRKQSKKEDKHESFSFKPNTLYQGDALDLIQKLDDHSIKCVVTSTPYWAMRIYDGNKEREWADGEICPFGLEQTPEGFIRHAVEVLYYLLPKLDDEGSIWWNVMDSYNTRTQIRESASEALSAMKGLDSRSWKDYKYKRYSSGHFYLKDGEQCQIPQRIAMRASQLGYYLKSTISWCKTASMPEPQLSRVSRNVEYILHLSKQRTPIFNKSIYLKLPPDLGGRQNDESEKLSDFWYLPTSAGRDGHGAQFPPQIPGRCIALSTNEDDLVLDPFIGSGTTAIAALKLGRQFIGFDISPKYIDLANQKIDGYLKKQQ